MQKLNPLIAIGFLIATVFWTGVLGWQASYAPTEIEKQKCYDAAHKAGHKSEECKTFWEKATSDPVAFFTLVLAISTVGLWGATIFLYRAGKDQLEFTKDAAAAQSEDMKASIAVAKESADAARDSVKLTEGTAQRQLRAYVGIRSVGFLTPVSDYGIQVEIVIENFGNTPAYDYRVDIRLSVFHDSMKVVFTRGMPLNNGDQTLMPGQQSVVICIAHDDVQANAAQIMHDVVKGTYNVCVGGKIVYRDAFGKPRFTNVNKIASGRRAATSSPFINPPEGNDSN